MTQDSRPSLPRAAPAAKSDLVARPALGEARLGDRALFPDIDARAYLAHAAISPLSLPVREQLRKALSDAATGVPAFQRWLPVRQRLRETLAALVGAAHPADIALVASTTTAVLDIAFGLRWKPGDRIILFEGEFPANTTPWLSAARTFGLVPTWVSVEAFHRSADEGFARLATALAPGAALVAVSAVQFQTGLRMPLGRIAELAHAHGARLFVDGIQACGVVPLDVAEGIDFLGVGSHKWLMGPDGGGFLYVAPDAMAALEPRLVGWLSHEEPLDFLFRGAGHLRYDRPLRQRADAFEIGTQASLPLIGLDTSVGLIASLGIEPVYEHVSSYLDALEPALLERGWSSARCAEPARRSGILSVRPPPGVDVLAVHHGLEARGIRCSTPDGWLRFAPHWPNSIEELPIVLEALDEAVAHGAG